MLISVILRKSGLKLGSEDVRLSLSSEHPDEPELQPIYRAPIAQCENRITVYASLGS